MSDWRVDDIDQDLAADFDDSLSGLGVELGTASYNMSEALLALPNLPSPFKQENDGSSDNSNSCPHPSSIPSENHPEIPSASTNSVSSLFSIRTSPNMSPTVPLMDSYQEYPTTLVSQDRFQHVLGAATSIATKMHEETLTYLNQGQSYEIKLKKLGDLSGFRGKFLKSVVKITFHERRLQYVADEQLEHWKRTRPGERVLDIDIPLSYAIFDIDSDTDPLNAIEFCWDPTKETGVFVKLNCISTEFTPKKHGGEKGVPFRIQIETFTQDKAHLLHKASCQLKVFKPKGADRKHKTDREKMEKRSEIERAKYQSSFDCTVFSDDYVDNIYPNTPNTSVSPTKTETICYSPATSLRSVTPQSSLDEPPKNKMIESTTDAENCPEMALGSEANAQQTAQWLQINRFANYVRVFSNFSGSDILRLSREDLIQICGLADGIRLHNALHSISIKPRLRIYVCFQSDQVYHALYLENLTCSEVVSKLAPLVGISCDNIHDIYIQGPNGIHVLVTNEVLNNINDESMFMVDIIQDHTSERVRILLKTS